VFFGLALLVRDVGEDEGAPSEQLHGFAAVLLLALTFTGLFLVAAREVRKRRARRASKGAIGNQAGLAAADPGTSHAGPRAASASETAIAIGFDPPAYAAELSAEPAGHASLCCSEELPPPSGVA